MVGDENVGEGGNCSNTESNSGCEDQTERVVLIAFKMEGNDADTRTTAAGPSAQQDDVALEHMTAPFSDDSTGK